MTDLKPCPFCASDNVRIAVTMHESWYYGECESCGGRTDFCDSQAEAIAAWNARAELGSGMCEKVYAVGGIIAQAECRDVCSDIEQFTCSVCGFNCDLTSWITPIGCDRPIVHHHHGTPNYCPNCGAKVVDA